MEQHFIEGDTLSFKEYLKSLRQQPVRFRKFGKWFVFSTLLALYVFIPCMVIMSLFGLLEGTFFEDPSKVLMFFEVILVFVLLIVWGFTFHHSFIAPATIKRRVTRFVRKCIPEAGELTRHDTETWFFKWKGHDFSIAYKNNTVRVVKNGQPRLKILRYFKIFSAPSFEKYVDWGTYEGEETPKKGLSLIYWNCAVNSDEERDLVVFACVKYKNKFSPEDISDVLEALLRAEETE